jgi:group I intron endonuclease
MKYEIYKITNKVNGKCYIGQTTIGYLKRFKQHLRSIRSKKAIEQPTPLQKAFIKYGLDNFICELIDNSSNNTNELNIKEIELIKLNNSIVPNGYNIENGGAGGLKKHKFYFLRKDKNKHNYRGVKIRNGNYRAIITMNGKDFISTTYSSAKEAAHAYDYKALELFGDDAGLNFPELIDEYKNKTIMIKNVKEKRREKKIIKNKKLYLPNVYNLKQKDNFIGIQKGKKGKWKTKFNENVYLTQQDAALAYDLEEFKINGEYANLNYPEKIKEYAMGTIQPNSYRRSTLSKYRGVTIHNNKWLAQVCINRRPKCIGYYLTEELAAKAYDVKAKELFGDKAKLNFPE